MRTNPPLAKDQNVNDFRVWEDLETEIVHADLGQLVDVSCVAVRTPMATDDLHILALTDDGRVWHTRGTGPNGDQFASWSAPTSVQLAGAPADGFSDIDAAALPGGGLTLVGLTRADPDKRRVLQATRLPSGNWTAASDLVAGAPTVITALPKRDFVVVTTCQSGVPEGRWRLVVLVGEYGPPAQVAFTVVSPGEEDWDNQPLTASSYTRPWDDFRRPLPYPIGGVSVAERPIAPTPPTP
jgi:hypothetical protein